MPNPRCRALLLLVVTASTVAAQDTTATKLPPAVTVTRQTAQSPFDLAFGISTVSPDSERPGQAHVAADQMLMMIPGVTVANRTNPSQDVRVSVRGFGARSQFGVRSVRIIRDGMPLTMPDGQTPLDYLDLESVGRIEVLRGTASALYGNASGGIIDIHSVDPAPQTFAPEGRIWFGSNATRRDAAVVSGTTGAIGYEGNIGETESNNYRAYSQQRLTNWFGRLTTSLGGTSLALTGLGLHMPVAQNPGALTQAQFDTAPAMADPQSVKKKARKQVDQLQIGLSATRAFGWALVTASGYGGTRTLYNPLIPNVVGVDRSMSGGSVRGDFDVPSVDGLRMTIGGDYQRQDDSRKNWANCNGLTATSASCPSIVLDTGVIQLNQRELVTGGGPYARLELDRGILHANAGVRSDAVRFQLTDHYLLDGDDSGIRTMRAVSPMAGVAFRLSRLSSVYANYSTAFETPTTTELGNQADSSKHGFNPNLQPQLSNTVELGTKGIASSVSYELAAFHTRVRDELIPFQSASTRTYYRNAGRTRRDGVEVSGEWNPSVADLTWAYSYSRFRFVDFLSGTTQMAGHTIPGIPEHQLQLSATRRFSGEGFGVAEWSMKTQVWADDANTVAAKRFNVLNLRGGWDLGFGHARFAPTVGVNNVFDTHYAGSLAVNAAGTPTTGKFFEPAPGRTWIVGARVLTGR